MCYVESSGQIIFWAKLPTADVAEPLADVATRPGVEESQAARYKRAMVVVNAIKGVGLLVDDSGESPPGRIVTALESLREDAIPDVRQGSAAVLRRIERLGREADGPLAAEPAAP
jgi:hypothetical protein